MRGTAKIESSIFTDFLRDFNEITVEIYEQVTKKNDLDFILHQNNMYFLLKKILFLKFNSLIEIPNTQNVLDNDNNLDSSFHFLESKYTEFISKRLISNYKFSISEEINQEFISPLIFSLLVENSIQFPTKQKKGIFFTSNDEVNFMCEEAIIHYLIKNTQISSDKIVNLISNNKGTNLLINKDEMRIILEHFNKLTILDPACGSGAFLIGMILLLRKITIKLNNELKNEISETEVINKIISKNLFGLDTNHEVLSVCKLRLNYIKAHFSENKGDKFRQIKYNLYVGNTLFESELKNEFPKSFDIVIGNPPFIRQEQFVKQNNEIESTIEFKSSLLKNLEESFDNEIVLPKRLKSDFYIYFFYKGISLLKKGGVLCFISSSSWLDVKFGESFKEILAKHFLLKTVIINKSRKSFATGVNATITIIVNPIDAQDINRNLVCFVTIKNPFSIKLSNENHLKLHIINDDFENKDIAIRIIQQRQLIVNSKKEMSILQDKWSSKFFKVTLSINKILDKIEDKLIPLVKIGKVRYSVKTGLNDFFYLNEEILEEFQIEKEFLKPVLKSPKKIKRLYIELKDLEMMLFHCIESKENLKKNQKLNALHYIEWGENQKADSKQQSLAGIPWPKIPSVLNNRPFWYSVREVQYADIFCNRFFNKRHYFPFTNEVIIEDQTFYGLLLNNEYSFNKELVVALLNSTFVYLMVELSGRASLGKGALQYAKHDYEKLLVIDPKGIDKNLELKMVDKFQSLLNRDIKPIFTECKMADRIAFDKLVFDYLGLSDDEIQSVYSLLIELVRKRLAKANQRIC